MDIALLALHVVIGALFAGHGAQKLFGAFGGYGVSGTAGFMESIGLKPGRLHAVAAGTAELVGGLLLAVGLVVPVAAMILIATMVTAIATVHGRNGVWATSNGYEYNLVLITALFALAGIGAGQYSLDDVIGSDFASTGVALAALAAGLVGGLGAVVGGRLAGRRADTAEPEPAAA
jgi:putative oxidoreductase